MRSTLQSWITFPHASWPSYSVCRTLPPSLCHIPPPRRDLRTLHWLLVKYRAQFKLWTLTYKAIHDGGPSYLKDMLTQGEHFTQRVSCCLRCPYPGGGGTELSPLLPPYCGTIFHLLFARFRRLMPPRRLLTCAFYIKLAGV